jgi:hypothetical protein
MVGEKKKLLGLWGSITNDGYAKDEIKRIRWVKEQWQI